MYTLKSLEAARARLDSLNERDGANTSGNLDKYHTAIRAAREELYIIEKDLKKRGLVPCSAEECMSFELDQLFPNAYFGEIYVHGGKGYCREARPLGRSRSRKTVTSWDVQWRACSDEALKRHKFLEAIQARVGAKLDELFPNAQSRQIVSYEGQSYMKRYVPLRKTNPDGRVAKWRSYWEPVES